MGNLDVLRHWQMLAITLSAIASASISAPTARPDASVSHEPARAHTAESDGAHRAAKKDAEATEAALPPLLATLAQTHTDERVMLDRDAPSQARFDALLADRVTGASHPMDPQLLALLRTLASRHEGARIELVSGFRSPKLNEMLRKKGHHVASHSQHSLGHACDFRIVPAGETEAIAPRAMEKEIRALGWSGGVGVYLAKSDWFVHADVGPKRSWTN